MRWIAELGGTDTPHWIDLVEVGGVVEGHDLKASVKWDGCIHLTRIYNGGIDAEDVDTIHICDLDTFIQELQALRDACEVHFGDPWPG